MDERDRWILLAARESAAQAIAHATRGGAEWLADALYVDAVAKRVEEVCELLLAVSDEQQARLSAIEWPKIRGMRNRLVHAYGYVNLDILGDVVSTTLPALIAIIDDQHHTQG